MELLRIYLLKGFIQTLLQRRLAVVEFPVGSSRLFCPFGMEAALPGVHV